MSAPAAPSPAPAPGDRRPIKTRETGWARRVTHWLAKAGATPNGISVAGMVAGIAAGGALAATSLAPEWARLWWLLGGLCVQLRLLANMFDGMVAVDTGQTSTVGELYNEVPDRISDVVTLIGLGWAAGGNPLLGLIAAVVAVFVAYVRALGKAAGAPNFFEGPMAKPQRMAAVTVTAVLMMLLPAAWTDWVGHGPAFWCLVVVSAGGAYTALRRLRLIAAALRTKPIG